MLPFRDRRDAGRSLATALEGEAGPSTIVMGLARGGVPVAYEVAKRLEAPLDVLIVRKLGVPGHEELAMGAIGPGGTRILNDDVIRRLGIPPTMVEAVAAHEQREAESRLRAYRRGRPGLDPLGRKVLVIDDGLATGASMRAALAAVRAEGAATITAAVPMGSPEACDELEQNADRVVCLTSPVEVFAVGQAYEDFSPTTDDEVFELLAAWPLGGGRAAPAAQP